MNKSLLLKIVNVLIALHLIVQIFSIISLKFLTDIIPYDRAATMHTTSGTVFIGLVLIHIYLNWSWIKANFFKKAAQK